MGPTHYHTLIHRFEVQGGLNLGVKIVPKILVSNKYRGTLLWLEGILVKILVFGYVL